MFRKFDKKTCILCGTKGELSGEHKIKRTQIKKIFGDDATFIGKFEKDSPLKHAQSSKSKSFHFENARLCTECNSSKTQAADKEFDTFCVIVEKIMLSGEDPS